MCCTALALHMHGSLVRPHPHTPQRRRHRRSRALSLGGYCALGRVRGRPPRAYDKCVQLSELSTDVPRAHTESLIMQQETRGITPPKSGGRAPPWARYLRFQGISAPTSQPSYTLPGVKRRITSTQRCSQHRVTCPLALSVTHSWTDLNQNPNATFRVRIVPHRKPRQQSSSGNVRKSYIH